MTEQSPDNEAANELANLISPKIYDILEQWRISGRKIQEVDVLAAITFLLCAYASHFGVSRDEVLKLVAEPVEIPMNITGSLSNN